jgi:hypothetical protein
MSGSLCQANSLTLPRRPTKPDADGARPMSGLTASRRPRGGVLACDPFTQDAKLPSVPSQLKSSKLVLCHPPQSFHTMISLSRITVLKSGLQRGLGVSANPDEGPCALSPICSQEPSAWLPRDMAGAITPAGRTQNTPVDNCHSICMAAATCQLPKQHCTGAKQRANVPSPFRFSSRF